MLVIRGNSIGNGGRSVTILTGAELSTMLEMANGKAELTAQVDSQWRSNSCHKYSIKIVSLYRISKES